MSVSSPNTFLGIPSELRLAIYDAYLSEHKRVHHQYQPSNAHLRILRTCSQIYVEAGPIFRSYISLLHERQIHAFIASVGSSALNRVTSADVANDGRLLQTSDSDQDLHPLSQLHFALRKLPSLKHLRVFECRQGLPLSLHSLKTKKLILKFEDAMYPSGTGQQLLSYELFISASTRISPFAVLPSQAVVALRLSGECSLPPLLSMPNLRQVTFHDVTGNHFDRRGIDQCFPDAHLDSFTYALEHKAGFEFRNMHFESLVAGHGSHLRKLVLLGCSRLTSATIATCLRNLPQLEYFALSLITVEELRENFVVALPPAVSVFKLHVINAWYAVPLLAEERELCNAIEEYILLHDPPLQFVAVEFRTQIMMEEGRLDRWRTIGDRNALTTLEMGPWIDHEYI